MPECGYSWTTTTTGKNGPEVHEHVCRKPAGHESQMHACVADSGVIHVVERRIAAAERIAP